MMVMEEFTTVILTPHHRLATIGGVIMKELHGIMTPLTRILKIRRQQTRTNPRRKKEGIELAPTDAMEKILRRLEEATHRQRARAGFTPR